MRLGFIMRTDAVTIKPQKILLIRTDKIGDVVLITPAIAALKKAMPAARISVLVKPYTAPLLKTHPDIDEVIEAGNFSRTLRDVRSRGFDAAIALFVDFRSAAIPFLARIPIRIGPASKIWSALFNRIVFQNRSQCLKHEALYNAELIYKLTGNIKIPMPMPRLYSDPKAAESVNRWLREELKISEKDFLIGIHPGSGGSARNWPGSHFARLAGRIQSEFRSVKIILTGNEAERGVLAAIRENSGAKPFILDKNIPLGEFMALISSCGMFITNSTGPLHIAAALGVPTVSFFPPIKACTPKRWGPLGAGQLTFVPEVSECKKCTGPECAHYDCMAMIDPDMVFEKIKPMLLRKLSFTARAV